MEIVIFLVAIVVTIGFAVSDLGPSYHFPKRHWRRQRGRSVSDEEIRQRIGDLLDNDPQLKGRQRRKRRKRT